jgi:lysozyme
MAKVKVCTEIEVPEIKAVSQAGLDFISNEEGCILHPYKDSVGVWTIGIGCTYWENGNKIKPTDKPITKERAYKLFKAVLRSYELTVYSTTRDDINQNQFDALTSLCFNIGTAGFRTSTVLKKVNANPNDVAIKQAFGMWKNAGSKKGVLLARRKREADLYFM